MYLYDYRELIKNLVISDLKAKYANSALGFAWSLINPLAMFIVYYFVFSNLLKTGSGFEAYLGGFIGYLLVGMVTWRFFQNGTIYAMNSIVSKSSLVTKIAIPRKILTLSIVLSNTISSIIEFFILVAILLAFGRGLPLTVLLYPVMILLTFMIVYGCGLLLSALYVYYRDMGQIWDVALQVGFFLSPIVYVIGIIPEPYKTIYSLNPLTVLIGMYRDIFLKGTIPLAEDFLLVLGFGVLMILLGSFVFERLSRRFAEVV